MTDEGEEFSWDDVAVVQEPAEYEATCIYFDGIGDLVIRQRHVGVYAPDDTCVVIARANVPALIAHLKQLLADDDLAAETPPKDHTAAERQRRRRAKERDTATESRRDLTVTEPEPAMLTWNRRAEKETAANG